MIEAPWLLTMAEAHALIKRFEQRLPPHWWTTDGHDDGISETFDNLLIAYPHEQRLAICMHLLSCEISIAALKLNELLGEETAEDLSRLVTKMMQDLLTLIRADLRNHYADDPEEAS